jgi:GDPmannose 4,6-dehydratase
MNKIALITGGGMDSKTLTHFLLSKNYHVFLATRRNTIIDLENFKLLFENDLIKNPLSKFSTLYLDVSDQNSIRNCIEQILKDAGKIDEIYHLAASSLVSYSYETPKLNIETNGMSALHFLDTIRQLTPKTKFYFAASTEMFSGNLSDEKYTENSKFYPKTPYACSKILGFDLTRYFRETYGIFALSGILANHSNIYRGVSFFSRKLTSTVAKIVTGKANELKIGHLDWARDEFYSDFGMEAAWKLLQLEKPQDTIIGNGRARWGEEFVNIAFGYFNLDWEDYIKFDSQFLRKNEVYKLEVNPKLACDTIGWKPERMSFKDHINFMCKYDYELESGLIPVRPNVFELYPEKS